MKAEIFPWHLNILWPCDDAPAEACQSAPTLLSAVGDWETLSEQVKNKSVEREDTRQSKLVFLCT